MFFPHYWRLSPSMLTFFAVELVEYHPWKSVLNQPVYRDDTGFWTPSILMNSEKKTTGRSADSWRCAALVNSLFLRGHMGIKQTAIGVSTSGFTKAWSLQSPGHVRSLCWVQQKVVGDFFLHCQVCMFARGWILHSSLWIPMSFAQNPMILNHMIFNTPFGKCLHNYGKSPFLIGKSTI
jgi:hypothetical protein